MLLPKLFSKLFTSLFEFAGYTKPRLLRGRRY